MTNDRAEDTESNLHRWERKLLIVAFGAWAGVVAMYGQAAISRIDRLVQQMELDRKESAEYRTTLERRITIIEQRQQYVLEALRQDGHRHALP